VGEIVIRRLKRQINDIYEDAGKAPRFSNRKIHALPPLRFGAAETQLLSAVREFRGAVKRAVPTDTELPHQASHFAIEVLSKRLLSGPWAFGQSWLNLLAGLEDAALRPSAEAVRKAQAVEEEDSDDDAEHASRQRYAEQTLGAWLRPIHDQVETPLAAVSLAVERLGLRRIDQTLGPDARRAAIASAAREVSEDARVDALIAWIKDNLRAGTGWRAEERLVIFTEYLNTLEYLRARLARAFGDDEDVILQLVGGMREAERDAVKRAFNDPRAQVRVLLATDAAGEGLNLQRSCRYLVHWDIPWNPGKMEQRNGRLDRHGQARDVTIFHFDSDDDASLRFLGKILDKRSQTREDKIATDDVFAGAIFAHFTREEDAERVEHELDQLLTIRTAPDDIPESRVIPGEAEQDRLNTLRREIDLSPETLRETLETALSIDARPPKLPRLTRDATRRDYLKSPLPSAWIELIDATLRRPQDGTKSGPLPAIVFDPAHYMREVSGRPVYTPEPDSTLLHLGHELYHRVMSTFARYRFPGHQKAASRWLVRRGGVPAGFEGVVQLTVEELAVNELREPCHHWVHTIRYAIREGELEGPLKPLLAAALPRGDAGDVNAARALWDDVDKQLKMTVHALQAALQTKIERQISAANLEVKQSEAERFRARIKEIQNERDRVAKQVEREANKKRAQIKQVDFLRDEQTLKRELAELEAEIKRRRAHYKRWLVIMRAERDRLLTEVLPKRYALRGDVRVYPIAVELRLPGGDA
jgi:hypothetical protein